ncbi:hypothetical protein HPB50_004391 [Hyalomma asiaticum]|uniref:Uncharacterized protein n=1 Tax=Hyalomma asiaticum TaxID=266040 RepID=A0ACB7RPC1_HYAAI|nr:hypothetical protein HPB50_004391 [Hyalomma asiaticum]
MPARRAKPHGEAESRVLAAGSRPECSAAPARTSTENDPEVATDVMDTDDEGTETQVSSVADAEDDSLSPDEVLQGELTSDAWNAEKDSAEEKDEYIKNGQWQHAMSLRQRKRLRKQERAAPDDSDARGGSEGNTCDARILAEERRRRASGKDRRRTLAAPPLPKNDMKIILRPRPGLVVKELKTYNVARTIERASGDAETCKSDKFLLRLRNGSNIIIASNAYEEVAEKILKIKALEFMARRYLKGVVHGLERDTPADELLSHLRVRTQGVTIVQARMLGKSQTAVITFDGPIVPRFVYYYGGEMLRVPYQPTRQYCKQCKSQGHRTDVCPAPMIKACSKCRLRAPPEDHICEAECALCGGPAPRQHRSAPKNSNASRKGAGCNCRSSKAQHKPNGILKRRWFSADREDFAPPGGAKRAHTMPQQHKGKKMPNKETKNKAYKSALCLPTSTSTDRLLSMGVHNSLTELTEAHRTAQLLRLSRTRPGRALLSTLKLSPLMPLPTSLPIPSHVSSLLAIDPLPKNMHPGHHPSRRAARASALWLDTRDALLTYHDITLHYRLSRLTFPPPHQSLSQHQQHLWRRIQAHTFLTPARLALFQPGTYSPACRLCGSSITNYQHIFYSCPAHLPPASWHLRSPQQWEAALSSTRPDLQLRLVTWAEDVAARHCLDATTGSLKAAHNAAF